MALSKIDTINAALSLLAVSPIATLSATTTVADFCNRNYEPTVEACLAMHPWRFAITQRQLQRNSVAPPGRWAAAYTLPADLLEIRAVTVGGKTIAFDRYERAILCDASVDEAVLLDYLFRPPEGYWPPLFAELVKASFASKIAAGIARKPDLAKYWDDRAFNAMDPKSAISQARWANDQGRTAQTLMPADRSRSRFLTQR